MRLIVAGSRTFDDREYLFTTLDRLTAKVDNSKLVVLSGHAKGADRLGEEWAFKHMVTVERYHPDWDRHGKAAGHMRNSEMVNSATHLVAFWDGMSLGTQDVIRKAKERGLKTRVFFFDYGEVDDAE